MATTSRSNSENNSTRNESSNFTRYEPQKHLTPTPHMTRMKFLQLRKLSDLSKCLRGKLYLIKIFLPNAKDILTNELSQYAKDKLLEIITSICHVDNGIETIGKDEELVKLIFCSFGNCTRNVRLQKTLFKFLSLVICEIQCNDESIWIRHFVNSYKYNFGPHILRILTEDNEPVIEIMTFLDILSDLTLPDRTNEYILEHLFKINDLVVALPKWFFTVFTHISKFFDEINFWIFIDKWIKILTVVIKFHVRSRPYDVDNDATCAVIQFAVSMAYIVFDQNLYSDRVFVRPVLRDNSLSVSPLCLRTTYQSIRLLSNLPVCNVSLVITDIILDILYMITFSESETGGNDQAVEGKLCSILHINEEVMLSTEIYVALLIKEHLDLREVGRKFQVIFNLAQKLHDVMYATRKWSFKDILEIILLRKHLYPSFPSIIMLRRIFLSNVPNQLQQKLDQLDTYKIELPYLLYRRRLFDD